MVLVITEPAECGEANSAALLNYSYAGTWTSMFAAASGIVTISSGEAVML
jgi:hypothetical protein